MQGILKIVRSVAFRAALKLVLLSMPLLAVVAWRVVAAEADEVEASMISRGKIIAKTGASSYGVVLDLGLRDGSIKLEDLLSPKYVPIVYAESLHVEETRFHTQFDQWVEISGVQRMEDEIKKSSPDILYAVGADIGAYVPVTHAEFSQAPTGDADRDRKSFRSKRKFNLPMHVTASLWEGADPLVQEYHRDTGDMFWDISAPVYVHDPATGQAHHFGCFRLGVRQDAISIQRRAAIFELAWVFFGLALVLAIFMFASLQRTMRPLVTLSEVALDISMGGAGMSKPIRSSATDEIGGMARSLERLRKSLDAAIRRID